MFEHSLIDLEEKKQPRRRWAALPIAIGLHVGLVAAVGIAQAWHVSEVPEPSVNVVFLDEKLPLPRAAAAPAVGQPNRPPVRPAADAPKTPTQPAQPVQPEAVPDEVPAAPATSSPLVADFAPISSDTGLGRPDGVPGGDGDSEGSVIGGPRDGVPHSPDVEPVERESVPIRVGGAVKRPDFLSGPQPRYTEMARKAGLQGVVILEAVIDEQGRVTDLRILKGLPMGLDQAAVDAVSQWRYKPATLNNRPVKVVFSLTVNFQLQR